MNTRERVLAAINREPVDRIPLMYRGLPETDKQLCACFGLGSMDDNWQAMLERLGADLFSSGTAMGRYSRLAPKYTGQSCHSVEHVEPRYMYSMDWVWGLIPQKAKAGNHSYIYYSNRPMGSFKSVWEVSHYPAPEISDFDFSDMRVDRKIQEGGIYCVGNLNHIFMLACHLRGMDRLLCDMVAEPIMAEAIINKVAEFAVELNRKSLEKVGAQADVYVLWDDVAMQHGMMMSPGHWAKYLKKWYAILFADAKKYGLKVFKHCCGSFHPIIPTLIDMGVDILDPVQTSAREMDLRTLKKRYGRNVCWHGGIDVQQLLPFGKRKDITAAVREAEEVFALDGGIVLGPSHEITPDNPIENILAIYDRGLR